MKTIIELREEAIKQDKNIEFYLYQLLEEKENIIKEVREYIEKHREYYYESVFKTDKKIYRDTFDKESSTKELLEILDKVEEK